MKCILLAILVLALNSQASRAQLGELIERNIEEAKRYDEETLEEGAKNLEPPRLWLHIQSDAQKQAAQAILDELKDDELRGRTIQVKPVVEVGFGPPGSQLRYFKKEDEEEAEELLRRLSGLVPGLELRDFSSEYADVGWIKPGHYELWLSPEVGPIAPLE